MSGAVPPPAARPLGRQPGFRAPCVPGAVHAGMGTQHRPHSVRPCGSALLAVRVAEGRSRGWVASTVVRGVCGQALPLAELPAHWAGCWGPPPTCCGRGCLGAGAQHCPLAPHALWGLRAVGVVGGRPWGGWPATVLRGVWCQALSLPRPPALWGDGRGSATRVSQVRSMRAWGPSTGPKACALAGRRCLLWGWRKGVPEGGAFHRCEGRLWSGAPPPRTARPLGGLLGSATHMLWARVCGFGGPTLSPRPACPVGAACREGGGRPSPGGVACHRCEGRLVSGAVPLPAARPLVPAAGVLRPVCPGCGRCGRGDPAPAPQRAPLWPGVARCGGGGRASPGEVPSTIARGVWCQALSLPRPPVLCSGQPGFRDPCVPGAVSVGNQHQPHSLRPGGPALLAVDVAEGRLPPLRGASQVRRCSSPDCPPTGRAVGVRHPRAVGAGVWLWGPNTVPLACMPCVGSEPRGWWGGRPRGGWPATVVRGIWCQALCLPRPPVLWSGQPGFRDPCVPGAVGAGVETQHRPNSVRPCGPALLAVGLVEGLPRGGCLPPL